MFFLNIPTLDHLLKYAANYMNIENVARKRKINPEIIQNIVKYDPDYDANEGTFGSIGMWLLKQIAKNNLPNDPENIRDAV